MKVMAIALAIFLSAFGLLGCQTAPTKQIPGYTNISANKAAIWFYSPIFRNVEDLQKTGEYGDKLEGVLTFPVGSQDKRAPVVVILHTCNDLGVTEKTISEHLLGEGFATLTFSNQGPRGWTPGDVCGGRIRGGATNWTQLGDAYSALAVLAKQPRIDPNRIAVVGASQGGGTAFLASSERVREKLVGKKGPKFAAHASFFPGGSYAFFGPEAHTGAPVLLMLGTKDDWTPAKRVAAAVNYLKSESPELPIEIKEYDAYHGWFSPASKSYSRKRKSFSNCPYTLFAPDFTKSKITVEGKVSRLSASEWRSMYRQCRKSGATLEGNADAATRSLKDVSAFLKKTMGG